MHQLFDEIDEDHNGAIDIDELTYFLTKNKTGMSGKAMSICLNMRGTKKISIYDLKDIFSKLPGNFTMSFLRSKNMKQHNLPDLMVRPKLDPCGLFFNDFCYSFNGQQNTGSVLKKNENTKTVQFNIETINGVPLPEQTA